MAAPQRNAMPLKAMRMYAPHTSHERRLGLRRMNQKRSGRFRSQTRSPTVTSAKIAASSAATTPKGSAGRVNSASGAATPSAPAEIDLVQRYDDTFQADVDPVRAEVALHRRVFEWVDVQRVVRARLHAGLAADAAARVEVDDPVGAAEERLGRADRDAGRIVAVIAAQHGEVPACVREHALLDVLDPRPEDAERNVLLLLARHRAGMAADTAALVDQESEFHRSGLVDRPAGARRNVRGAYGPRRSAGGRQTHHGHA